MRRKFYILLCFAVACVCANAQLRVESGDGSWGEIGWHCAKTQSIVLHNKSRHAVVLMDVRTDCGCLVTSWQKGQLLEAGQRAIISATYDANTLGHFKKAIRVYAKERDGEVRETEMWVSGQVVPFVVDYSLDYPYSIGEGLYLTGSLLEFDDVRHGDAPQQVLRIVNGTKQNYTPSLMHMPSWLSVKCEPAMLRPGHSGRLVFTADAGKISRYGLTQTSVYVSRHLGDRVGQDNELEVTLTLVPNVSPSSANSPRAEVDSVVVLANSGVKKARRTSGSVFIRNVGGSDLQINRLQVYNTGLKVSLSKSTIAPGQNAVLRVSGWAETDNNDKGRRRILLITNDPLRPKITIDVK